MRRLTAACVGMLAACFMIGDARSAFGQGRCETADLRPDGDGSSFGRGVSILGDWVMVGAIGDDDRGPLAGAAYLFRKVDGAWVGHAKIYATDTAPYDRFGYDISQSADAALIGSFADAAYVFRNVGGVWTEEAKLTPSDGDETFGEFVSLSGDTALVGCIDAAYVFRKVDGVWSEEAKLLPDGSSGATGFGRRLELDGDVAVIGDHLDNNNGQAAGAAYFFASSAEFVGEFGLG